MSDAAAPVAPAAGVAPAPPWVPVLLAAVVGAALAWVSSLPAPEVQGARRITSPPVLLAVHAALTAVLLARPGRRGASETAALVAAAAPFLVALSAAAGAGAGFLPAFALAAAAWTGAAVVMSRIAPRVATAGAALLAFALPLAAYGLADFARLPTRAAFLASPLTGPVLLAHRADAVGVADAVPALVAGALLLAAGLLGRSFVREARA